MFLLCKFKSCKSLRKFKLVSLASFCTSTTKVLTSQQLNYLDKNGFLHIPQFVSPYVTNLLKNRILQLLDEFDPNETTSVFTSHRTDTQYKDEYFLNSGDKIRYFWEENVFDSNNKLITDKKLGINKIGHALHTKDKYFKSYVFGFIGDLCFDIGMKYPCALQSMYIFKQAYLGGQVSPHQDSTFLYTTPESCYGFWLSIDITDENNGCLYAIPGSHKDNTYGLKYRFIRISKNETKMIINNNNNIPLPNTNGIPLKTNIGDLLIFHGRCVHWSNKNESNNPRHAFMQHCIDLNCYYPKDNWLQYPNGVKSFPTFDHSYTVRINHKKELFNQSIIQ